MVADRTQAVAWYERGFAAAKAGDMNEAITCLLESASHDRTWVQPWILGGDIFIAVRRYHEAITSYERALAVDQNNALAWLGKGIVLDYHMGRRAEGIACYDRAIALDPQLIQAIMNKGNSVGIQGDIQLALECFDRVLSLDATHADAWHNKGFALGDSLGRWAEALVCFENAIKFQPGHAASWYSKGQALCNGFGRYEEALSCFAEARRLGNPLATAAIKLCRQQLEGTSKSAGQDAP